MSAQNHISPDDLALLALQLLPEREHAEALAHLQQCPECREEFARLQGDLALYALSVDMHSPPAYAQERLMKQVAREKKVVPIARGSKDADAASMSTAKTSSVWAWSGWAVAAALAAVSVLQYTQRQTSEENLHAQIKEMATQSARAQEVLKTLTDSRAKQVGLHLATAGPAAPKSPDAHAAYMADSGSLVFFASGLQPLQPYKTYELWLLPANGHDPIAAGIFKPDANGNANVVMPNLPKGIPASGFGVTIEDEGGSKQPTLPIVMSGS